MHYATRKIIKPAGLTVHKIHKSWTYSNKMRFIQIPISMLKIIASCLGHSLKFESFTGKPSPIRVKVRGLSGTHWSRSRSRSRLYYAIKELENQVGMKMNLYYNC